MQGVCGEEKSPLISAFYTVPINTLTLSYNLLDAYWQKLQNLIPVRNYVKSNWMAQEILRKHFLTQFVHAKTIKLSTNFTNQINWLIMHEISLVRNILNTLADEFPQNATYCKHTPENCNTQQWAADVDIKRIWKKSFLNIIVQSQLP